mgnify:CR=1 FL=1
MKPAIPTFAFIIILSSCLTSTHRTEIEQQERTNIDIIFPTDERIFPDNWYSATIAAKSTPLDSNEYDRTTQAINNALSMYPKSIILQNIKTIYVVKDMEFFGQPFGGTNSNSNVYMTNNGADYGYTSLFLEKTFHHEFSSILLRNYEHFFDTATFTSYNAPGFEYGEGGVEAIRENQVSLDYDKQFNELGLISQYSASSLENDINLFAENLFSPEKGFKRLINKYEGLRNKRSFMIDFYHQIDTSFTVEFFEDYLQ